MTDVKDNTCEPEIRIRDIANSDSEQLLKSFGSQQESIINNQRQPEYFKQYTNISKKIE
jgi:hypothetical protein